MNIVVNGKSKKIKTGTTIVELLNSEGYSNWVGVWVNNIRLLQKDYPIYKLKEKDEIKIIRPLGGG
ncbi:sulfur carrier protein ThiS [Clostridium sp. Cult1]|jgi:sulfur carrier protein|uniref:sulfur carrier protein ThiS n=1 Tax=Clostridium sp. Cult1 TaxID=2079002 RepID=UPI001EFFB456|nr:sulfur carrier protein ThiS [Clostridium sp. Cult1]MCF6462353.1 thiamine biosynthesis protein ThiS [Clostridium sp. Cult1]